MAPSVHSVPTQWHALLCRLALLFLWLAGAPRLLLESLFFSAEWSPRLRCHSVSSVSLVNLTCACDKRVFHKKSPKYMSSLLKFALITEYREFNWSSFPLRWPWPSARVMQSAVLAVCLRAQCSAPRTGRNANGPSPCPQRKSWSSSGPVGEQGAVQHRTHHIAKEPGS